MPLRFSAQLLLRVNKKTRWALCSIAFYFLLMPTSHALSLSEVYQLATENDPVIKAAKANYKADDTIRAKAIARLLPTISAGYSWTKRENSEQGITGLPVPDFESETKSISATQNIFNLQAIFGYRQALATANQAQLGYIDAQQELIVRTAESYFGLLRAQDNLTSARAEETAIGRQLEQTQQRYEVGLIAITDVHEAQAAFDLTVANRLALEASLGLAKENLAQLTGQHLDNVNQLSEDYESRPPTPANIDAWVELAEESNISYKIATSLVKAASENVRVQRSGFAPTVEGFAQYDKNRGGFLPGLSIEDTRFGVRANWELFRGGAKWAENREASYQSAASKANLVGAKRSVIQQVRSAYLTTSANAAEVNARQRRVISATSALDATQAGYDAGTRNIVDLLNAQQDLYAAQRDYSNARYDFVINSLQLKRAAGIITAADLESIPTE